jgi:glycosyltransferase involved in cell wall biosynthesis
MLLGTRIFCIVPAYNEEARLGRVLRTLPTYVDVVLVVNDASADGTEAAALAEQDARVVHLRHDERRGVGAAIVTGYERALAMGARGRDALVVMAGDGQMDPRDLRALVLPVAENRADYVKGDRFAQPTLDKAMPWGRRLGGRVFSKLTSLAVGIPISDSQCGFTALAAEACASLALNELYPGYGYPNDLLGQCARANLRIGHVPVRAVYAGEKSGLGLRHLPTIAFLVGRARVRRGLALRGDGGLPSS